MQLLTQLKTLCPAAKFSAVFGLNSCLTAKLVSEDPPGPDADEDLCYDPENDIYYRNVVLKNVERIVKKRGVDNVIFLDNNLYSYINYSDNYVPVPKFVGKENSCLFFLKFFLEDFVKGREPILSELIEEYGSCD